MSEIMVSSGLLPDVHISVDRLPQHPVLPSLKSSTVKVKAPMSNKGFIITDLAEPYLIDPLKGKVSATVGEELISFLNDSKQTISTAIVHSAVIITDDEEQVIPINTKDDKTYLLQCVFAYQLINGYNDFIGDDIAHVLTAFRGPEGMSWVNTINPFTYRLMDWSAFTLPPADKSKKTFLDWLLKR